VSLGLSLIKNTPMLVLDNPVLAVEYGANEDGRIFPRLATDLYTANFVGDLGRSEPKHANHTHAVVEYCCIG